MLLNTSLLKIFTRRQKEGESADEFVTQIQKLTRIIETDDKSILYAILNSLNANIVSFVIQIKAADHTGRGSGRGWQS
jgi:hypothetical protein